MGRFTKVLQFFVEKHFRYKELLFYLSEIMSDGDLSGCLPCRFPLLLPH